MRWRPSRALLGAWLALLLLLTMTVALSYVPLGSFNGVIALLIERLADADADPRVPANLKIEKRKRASGLSDDPPAPFTTRAFVTVKLQ